ncbi:hypothetical protein [Antarctobacter heliothermus]|uniref:Uncharacterized protein n=1 Tax=Antarctobacter heliothermus TaxID=74033 RepID=A0A239M4B2_9RHOB|nr:hypothetical protein [Antarctobacter heliothermus]SNT37430.1 hypothetical protein SAMN04488078_11199 [Antarctobacter heliothermus]
MKTLIASALIATAAFTGTAHAMTAPTLDREAQYIVPGADFSSLTASEVHVINNIVHGGGGNGEKRAQIKSFLQ